MNNVSFYFRNTINGDDFCKHTLQKLLRAAAEKYVACAYDFKHFHTRTTLAKDLDQKLCQIVYVVVRSFFKYLVCNVTNSVYNREHYHKFFVYALKFFEERFCAYKNYFGPECRIMKQKIKKLETEKADFQIL